MWVTAFMDGKEDDREPAGAYYRTDFSCKTICDAETANVLVKANHMITPKRAAARYEQGCG